MPSVNVQRSWQRGTESTRFIDWIMIFISAKEVLFPHCFQGLLGCRCVCPSIGQQDVEKPIGPIYVEKVRSLNSQQWTFFMNKILNWRRCRAGNARTMCEKRLGVLPGGECSVMECRHYVEYALWLPYWRAELLGATVTLHDLYPGDAVLRPVELTTHSLLSNSSNTFKFIPLFLLYVITLWRTMEPLPSYLNISFKWVMDSLGTEASI